MTPDPPRPAGQRKSDTLALLEARGADVWVATASSSGGETHPYLVPLSLAWLDERVVIALRADSRTAGNIVQHRQARLALDGSRDVVMIDAVLDRAVAVADAEPSLARRYAEQAEWDPAAVGGNYVFLLMRPERIQAWREENELAGRTLMRGGAWIV